MNILYEGISGSAANPQLGGLLFSIGVVVMIAGILLYMHLDIDDNCLFLLIIPLSCILIGIFNLVDSRRPVVKATLNDTIPFTEIQEHYEYVDKEGDIYIFKPRNINIDEWEQQIKEQNKEAEE